MDEVKLVNMEEEEIIKKSSTHQFSKDWKQLQFVQNQLQSVTPTVLPLNESKCSQRILQEQEKRYKAEIDHLKENRFKFHPNDPDPNIQKYLLEQSKKSKLEQLEETLCVLRAIREDVVTETVAESETNRQLQCVNDTLREKLTTLGGISSSMGHLKAHLDEVNQLNRFFKRELKQLLMDSFDGTEKNKSNNLNDTREFEGAPPMTALMKELIEKSMNSPAQPYIDLDDRFCSTHVEFLLRNQVVVKDPNNLNRLKLVPFHL